MQKIRTAFTEQLNIRYPIIMAPMFLVSNEAMMKSAMDSGIVGVFPSLNFRKEGELEALIQRLHAYKAANAGSMGSFGVNIIAQNTNPLYKKHLEICIRLKVPFFITSLGFPGEVIEQAHSYGGIVYCDVINQKHAKKVFEAGCDGFIAVGAGAGGHAGPYPLNSLVPALMRKFPGVPVVAAGGVADGQSMLSMLVLGAAAVSVGTRFIASPEATVNEEYKQAIVDAGMEDIVLTTRLSGTPCNIINTPYAQKLGYKQNWLERILNKNPRTKKYFKMLVQFRGVKKLEKAIKPGNYNSLWSAGQSSDAVTEILPCAEIVQKMISEMKSVKQELDQMIR